MMRFSTLISRRVFLHYVARPKLPGIPHHAKAGNINHTLKYIYDDAYAERECVIIFDADFMPRYTKLIIQLDFILLYPHLPFQFQS